MADVIVRDDARREPEQVPTTTLERVLARALSRGADFADIYIEEQYNALLKFLDSKVKDSFSGIDRGAGVRVFYGGKAYYAYTNDLSESGLLRAADAVAQADQGGAAKSPLDLVEVQPGAAHPYQLHPRDVAREDKIALLARADKAIRGEGPAISQAEIRLLERVQRVTIANSEGLLIRETRPYTRLYFTAIAGERGEKQTGSEGPGALRGFEYFETLDIEGIGAQVARSALTMLKADYAPAGKMPVVIDNGFGGVIFHEACGHALETTSVAKNASVFAGKLGQPIASPVVTAIDDGTIGNEWGSLAIDDEGLATRKTTLIENGVLTSYIVDRLGAVKTGYAPTGSGRRESYRYAPASRMRNTYIAPGASTLEQMIASIDRGIYAKKMGGGSVTPGTGDFNFAVQEGYMIRNGKIAEPVRGASLIGNGADTLMKIDMVGDELKLAQGMCGSVSGSVPVTVGQPALRVAEIVVGGR